MRYKFLLATAALAMTFHGSANAAPVDDYTELREEIWQYTLDESPMTATSVGDRRGDGKLGDNSLAAYDSYVAESRAFLVRLNAIETADLPQDMAVDYAILKRSLEDAIAESAFDH